MSYKKTHVFKFSTGRGIEFSSTPTVYKSAGFKLSGTSLVDGFTPTSAQFNGVDKILFPENLVPKKIFHSQTEFGERIYALFVSPSTNQGEIYYFNPEKATEGFVKIEGITCEKAHFCSVKYFERSAVAITSGEGEIFVHDGETLSDGLCPSSAEDIIYYNQRLIVLTKTNVYVSNEHILDFDYSNKNIYPIPDGFNAKKMVACGDGLMIAGEHGLARFFRLEYAEGMSLKMVCVGAERFFPKTMASVGEGVYILGENGLNCFDGVGLSVVHHDCAFEVEDGLCAFLINGEYHASVKTTEITQKQAVLTFSEGKWYASNSVVNDCTIADGGERVYYLTDKLNTICTIGGGYLSPVPVRRYLTSTTDFGVDGNKTITCFAIRTDTDVILKIKCDGKTHLWVMRSHSKNNKCEVHPNIMGREFSFEIVYEGVGSKIYPPTVTYEYC